MYEADLIWFEAFPPLGGSPKMAPTTDEGFKDLATGYFHGHAKTLFRAGPYWVAVHLESDGGPLELSQYRVSLLPTAERARPVMPTSDTRLIPLNEMVITARERYAEHMARLAVMDPASTAAEVPVDHGFDPESELAGRKFYETIRDAARRQLDAPQRSRMGRPPLTFDQLFDTAFAYVTAERSGRDPVNAVRRKTGLSESGAYKRIRQAREANYMDFVRADLHDTARED